MSTSILPIRTKILDLFLNKCVRCRRPAVTVHEIIPKSLAPKTWMMEENMVAICFDCHEWAHERGTNNSREELKALREQRLREYYAN